MMRRKIIQRTISVLEGDACVVHLDPSHQGVWQEVHSTGAESLFGLLKAFGAACPSDGAYSGELWKLLSAAGKKCPGLQQCPGHLDFCRFRVLRQTWEKMTLWNSGEMHLQKTRKGPQSNNCSASLLWGWPHGFPVPGKQQDFFGFEDWEKFAHFHLLSSLHATRLSRWRADFQEQFFGCIHKCLWESNALKKKWLTLFPTCWLHTEDSIWWKNMALGSSLSCNSQKVVSGLRIYRKSGKVKSQ